jgi:hypothetical protein
MTLDVVLDPAIGGVLAGRARVLLERLAGALNMALEAGLQIGVKALPCASLIGPEFVPDRDERLAPGPDRDLPDFDNGRGFLIVRGLGRFALGALLLEIDELWPRPEFLDSGRCSRGTSRSRS